MGFPSKITCFGASQLPRCGDTQAHMVRNHDLPTSPWLRSRPTIRFPLTDASGTVWVQPQKNLNQNHPVKLLLDSGPRESVWDNVCSTLLNFGCNLAHANRYTPGASQVAPVVRTHRPVLEIQQTWVRSRVRKILWRRKWQYSCLENSRDRETWQATVHGVANSQTRWKMNR